MPGQPGSANPKVSVIIATYNYSCVLRYAIATVLWQTFRDFELIVVGDCCTDDSQAVVESFGDPRIQWVNLTENSGSKSLPNNAGLARARGEYIAYLAHDDLWHPAHLQTLVDALDHNACDFAYTVAVFVPPPGQMRRDISGIFPDRFREGYALVHSTVIHRKAVIDRMGTWPDYRLNRRPPDDLFWSQALQAGLVFLAVPKVTVWKFTASSRPGSYVDKKCDEQAHYFELIQHDPALAEKELLDVVRSAMAHGLGPMEMVKVGRDAPLGACTQWLRQIRGLETHTPMEALPAGVDGNSFGIEIAEDVPRIVAAGTRLEFEVRIENGTDFAVSSHEPFPVYICYHWLDPQGAVAVHEGIRTLFLPPLRAHSSGHYVVKVQAPPAAGTFQLQLVLVQEKIRWFDGPVKSGLPTFEVQPAEDG